MPARISATRAAQVTFTILLAAALALLAAVVLPLWKPLFTAAVLAATLAPLNEWITRRLRGRRRLGAAVTTLLLVLVVLAPITVLTVIGVGEAIDAIDYVRTTLAHGGVDELVRALPASIEEPARELVGMLPASAREQAAVGGQVAASLLSRALTAVGNLAFTLVMMLIAFYALILDGHRLLAWVRRVSPMPETHELLGEARQVAGLTLRSTFVTALVQAVVATAGYAIASVPNPIFFGLLTFFAAFIPSVGTALVGLPLTGLLYLSGLTWQPIFLAVWSLGLVGTIDNLLRPLLIGRGEAQLNGVVVFFSLIGGIAVFGGVGILVGPLAVTFFLAMVRFAYRDYVQPSPPVDAET